MGHYMPSDSSVRTKTEFFPAQAARVESCLQIVAPQTRVGVNILNSGVSDLGTHQLIKSFFFLVDTQKSFAFGSFLKLWLHSVVLFCNIYGARMQAAAFSPTLPSGARSFLTVWLASPRLHPAGQPSHFHLVNPQELFWVWPAFNPLFLPVQAQPLYSPGTLSSKETFAK